jgi:transcriptional regulator with XRE-family HTH domain
MNRQSEQPHNPHENADALDALYAAWSDDRTGATPKPLRDWIAKFPAHAAQLVDWTTDRPLVDCADNLPHDPALEQRVAQIGVRALQQFRSRAAAESRPLVSLKAAAERRGLTLKSLAGAMDLGLPIVAKLEQRLLRAESIPGRLLDRLADTLQVTRDQVAAYLSRPPALSATALYRADSAPKTGDQEEFNRAIETCAGMSAEQKRAWLEPDTLS